MQRQIKALVIEPNKLPEIQMIDNSILAKEKIVGGELRYVYSDNYPNVVIICNDDGQDMNLPFNRFVDNDLIKGTFMIVRDDPEIGEDRSLTEKQIKKYQEIFNDKSIFETKFALAKIKKELKNNDLAI